VGYAEKATADSVPGTSPTAVSHESVESTFINSCRDSLNVSISRDAISTAHRMKSGPKDMVRPIIVRFTNRRIRDEVYRARKLLKRNFTHSTQSPNTSRNTPHDQQPIYISEHLTKPSSELFYLARKLLCDKKNSQPGLKMVRCW